MDRLFHLLFLSDQPVRLGVARLSASSSLFIMSGFWSFTEGISREYVLIQEQMTWYGAQAYCRENHIDLATVQNDDEWANLQKTVHNMAKMAWVGLYNDINSWRWSYKDEKITFQIWSSGEPNNFAGEEACGLLQYGTWNDWNCNGLFPFFCFNENSTNKFVFVSDAKTWKEAQIYCRRYYTDLVVIRNQTENNQLPVMMRPHISAWIGLFRDTWKWSDATNFSTSSNTWLTNPDMITLQIPCGVSDTGTISYQVCTKVFPFLCTQRTKTQIVRVKIKSGHNLNDPTMLKIILQWTNLKLKEWGIEKETRVAWRIQPNGKVFSRA